ncbi:Hsp70 family protein [Arcticibacter eurypsychrophilus]|uniref:Hsp70 family protein n=1 Tax=Arcticibacter eurypsychrophilus TaxID=1434752 RepID=UPI00084D6D31|nr:Hsp70 family protein [Arcticibacter eurypsychrophilus]
MSKELTIKNLLPIKSDSDLNILRDNIHNKTFVGIDFGTSTTVVSIAMLDKNTNEIIAKSIDINQKLDDGTTYSFYRIPSVVAWYNNKLLIGEGAKKLKYKLKYGKNVWHSFKMELGEDVGCKYPNSELGKDNPGPTLQNPTDVTKLFFRYLKTHVDRYVDEKHLPKNIEYAISIPASFEANQRKDLISSIEANGIMLNRQSLIDEPNAAFLSYVLSSTYDNNNVIKLPENYYPNVLVFDFGAGTCDISILEIGQDVHGVYSKNIAISKFDKLGGDDVDKLIAIDVLLPKLFENSFLNEEDFRTRELKELIIPNLLAAAERLKIQLCEAMSLKEDSSSLVDLKNQDFKVSWNKEIEIHTSKGILVLKGPEMSIRDFVKVNAIFTNIKEKTPTNKIEKEYEFISIFNPINSALKKAKLKPVDIDYILFIGGSSKNPFIQYAVKDFFKESTILLPKDLQAHVSIGAAIHSLVLNGYGKNIIQPITSEPILLINKDDYREIVTPIIEAGTLIPSDINVIDNLTVQRDNQNVIELPICVGNKNKILYNIKMHKDDGTNFISSDRIRLELEINADKILQIRAVCGDHKIMVEPLSPFANKELSTEDRIVHKAERDFNLESERNGGEPTLISLRKLHTIYETLGREFKAAETLELLEELFPGNGNLNNIGLHYSKAGKEDKAIKFYKKHFDKFPSANVAFNIAMHFKNNNAIEYGKFIQQAFNLDSNDEVIKFNFGRFLISNGEKVKGGLLIDEAFESWKKRYSDKDLHSWDYSWFSSCAAYLGKSELSKEIEDAEPNKETNAIYNSENLSQAVNNKKLNSF